jgi:hypothetical protein
LPLNSYGGTPAMVLDDREVSAILGKGVRSNAGEDTGRIVDVIVGRDGRIHAAIIDFGGFLNIGTRKVAVDWSALDFAPMGKPGAITLAHPIHERLRLNQTERLDIATSTFPGTSVMWHTRFWKAAEDGLFMTIVNKTG